MSELARKLRKNPTAPEIRFWQLIASIRTQFHFRKQVAMGPYVVDFASHKAKLVIEIDGDTHYVGSGPIRDRQRDAALNARGYRVLRFTNADVMENPERVWHLLNAALPSPPP